MQGRRPRTLNPAFAAAHGIQSNEDGINNKSGNKSLEAVVKRAQDTGKLIAHNCSGLEVPLPDALFHFPFGLCHYTEDVLTVVDFSDNEEKLGNSVLDERISKYRNVKTLRFRNCGIKLPPPESQWSFSSFENLTILDLSRNKLDGKFDVGILLCSPDKVSHLTELNLSHNQMKEVVATNSSSANSSTVSLPYLQTLDVSHNPPLQRLFDESKGNAAFSCETLRVLQCHHNPNLSSTTTKASIFPFLASSKATLEVLEVSHNPKLGISGTIDLSEFDKLRTVNFELCKLEEVPCIPHSVNILNLRTNKLKSIEGMLSNSSSSQLVDLFLDDNYLTHLDPLVIETMVNLKRLNVFSNKIRTLPYQLGFLSEMVFLNISGNPVFTRFSSLANNPNKPTPLLEKLRARAPVDKDGNHTSNATTVNLSSGTPSQLLTTALSSKGHTTLDLAGKLTDSGSAALEGLVQELKSRTDVDQRITGQVLLDSNTLEFLPEKLFSSCLPRVQTISLTNNRLAQLPISLQFSSSKFVRQLHLRKNRLTFDALKCAFWFQPVASAPSSMSWSLKALTHLDLSLNNLTSFPIDTSSSVHCFPALENLNLSNNKISSLDDWKRLPESLAVLDLSENSVTDIEHLSVLLAGCPKLQRISLYHNNIRNIPASLGLISEYASNSMFSLDLRGNPQRGIPTFALDKPCSELLKYLFNRLTPAQKSAAIEKIEHHKQCANQEQSMEEETSTQEKNDAPTTLSESTEESDHTLLEELQESIEKFKIELADRNLTQAKKYAMKKALAMERSKLIREERRLGLRK